jgi:hypothetical protein
VEEAWVTVENLVDLNPVRNMLALQSDSGWEICPVPPNM